MNPTDHEPQEATQCERCESFPATREICYQDPRFSREDGIAWDLVCEACAHKADDEGEVIR